MALAVFLRPGRVGVLLAPLRRLPVGGHRALLDESFLASAVVLPGRRHQRGVDDLTATRDESMLEQLRGDAVEQRLGPCFTDPVLEGPHGGAVGDVRRVRQSAEPFVAHAVEQLVLRLFIREVVQTFQNKNANHRLGRVRRTSALRTHRTGRHPINLHRQGSKVNVRLDLNQWITQRVDFLAVVFVGEQVKLDGAMWFHRQEKNGSQDSVILPSLSRVGESRFFEAPKNVLISSGLNLFRIFSTLRSLIARVFAINSGFTA